MSRRNKIPADIRLAVYEGDVWSCRHCGFTIPPNTERERMGINVPSRMRPNRRGEEKRCELQIDHIHPRSLGGTDMADNLQSLCTWCNRRKLKHTGEADWDVRFTEAQRLLSQGPPSLQAAQHIVEALIGERLYIKSKTGNDYNQIGGMA